MSWCNVASYFRSAGQILRQIQLLGGGSLGLCLGPKKLEGKCEKKIYRGKAERKVKGRKQKIGLVESLNYFYESSLQIFSLLFLLPGKD